MELSRKELFDLIDGAFLTDEDLVQFCSDYYAEVYGNFGGGGKSTKIRALINYVIQHVEEDELLKNIEAEREKFYNKYMVKIGKINESVSATSSPVEDVHLKSIDFLEKLYTNAQSARVVVSMALIPTEQMDFSGGARVMWFNIMQQVKNLNMTKQLLVKVLEDYPNQSELKEMLNSLK